MKEKTNVLAGSHIPVLVRYLQELQVYPSLLELGMGFNSTPLMHWMNEAKHGKLVSYETDKKWFEINKEYQNENHDVRLIDRNDWDELGIYKVHWDLAFIDCRPAIKRKDIAVNLMNVADVIILHDAEPEIKRFYQYDKIVHLFKYHRIYSNQKPHTLVLSNKRTI